jgi:hypothetical protein
MTPTAFSLPKCSQLIGTKITNVLTPYMKNLGRRPEAKYGEEIQFHEQKVPITIPIFSRDPAHVPGRFMH